MADVLDRAVIDDRLKNIMNTIESVKGSGIASGGWLFNLVTGFAQNNRKLLYGSKYPIPKGQFKYPFPVQEFTR